MIDEGFADELMEGTVDAGITEDKKGCDFRRIRFPAKLFQHAEEHGLSRQIGMRPDAIQNKGGNER